MRGCFIVSCGLTESFEGDSTFGLIAIGLLEKALESSPANFQMKLFVTKEMLRVYQKIIRLLVTIFACQKKA